MPAVRVFLVDDSQEFIGFVKNLVQEFAFLEVVGAAQCAEEALEPIQRLRPDLVLMDLSMSGMSGLQATRLLKAQQPAPRVILVTGSDTPEYRAAASAAQAD